MRYLTEQFAMPTTLLPDIATPPPTVCVNTLLPCEQSEWWQTMLTAPDQLRQRVAFALSEMFVVSTNSVNARSVTTYQNTLANDAFANFYDDHAGRDAVSCDGRLPEHAEQRQAGHGNGVPQIANENYARELMQLFTTGLVHAEPGWNAAAGWERESDSGVYGGAGAGVCAGVYGMDVCQCFRHGRAGEVSEARRTTRCRWRHCESAARYDGEGFAERDDASGRAVDDAGPERAR